MSAIGGSGMDLDISMNLGTNAKTTTSEFKCVYISADNTVSITDTTTNQNLAIGILQNQPSSGSLSGAVRLSGISRAVCNASVTAGRPIVAAAGGNIAELAISSTVATVGTLKYCLGYAREAGVTNTVISVILDKSLYAAG